MKKKTNNNSLECVGSSGPYVEVTVGGDEVSLKNLENHLPLNIRESDVLSILQNEDLLPGSVFVFVENLVDDKSVPCRITDLRSLQLKHIKVVKNFERNKHGEVTFTVSKNFFNCPNYATCLKKEDFKESDCKCVPSGNYLSDKERGMQVIAGCKIFFSERTKQQIKKKE